jgi:hypothetical protein
MTDYLSRAVERETSAAPGVRPALPSLFEPGKASVNFTALETESPSDGDPSRIVPGETNAEVSSVHDSLAAVTALWTEAAAAPEPSGEIEVTARKTSAGFVDKAVTLASVAIPQPKPDSSPQQPPRAATAEPVVRPTAERVVRPTAEPVARPTAEPVARPTAEAAPRPPQAVPAEPLVRPTPASRPSELPAAPALSERVPTPRPRPARTEPTARPMRESLEPKPEPPPAVAPVTHIVAPAPATVSRVSPAPSREQARNGGAARNDASAPRAIHITIGRIEVRAVHPPAEPAAPHPAPASSRITLEEYLKQRNRVGS